MYINVCFFAYVYFRVMLSIYGIKPIHKYHNSMFAFLYLSTPRYAEYLWIYGIYRILVCMDLWYLCQQLETIAELESLILSLCTLILFLCGFNQKKKRRLGVRIS